MSISELATILGFSAALAGGCLGFVITRHWYVQALDDERETVAKAWRAMRAELDELRDELRDDERLAR